MRGGLGACFTSRGLVGGRGLVRGGVPSVLHLFALSRALLLHLLLQVCRAGTCRRICAGAVNRGRVWGVSVREIVDVINDCADTGGREKKSVPGRVV